MHARTVTLSTRLTLGTVEFPVTSLPLCCTPEIQVAITQVICNSIVQTRMYDATKHWHSLNHEVNNKQFSWQHFSNTSPTFTQFPDISLRAAKFTNVFRFCKFSTQVVSPCSYSLIFRYSDAEFLWRTTVAWPAHVNLLSKLVTTIALVHT